MILQIEDDLSILNPTVILFKRICAACRENNLDLISTDTYDFKQRKCKQLMKLLSFIKGNFLSPYEWLYALVHMPMKK